MRVNRAILLRAIPLFVALSVVLLALLTLLIFPERAWENDTPSYVVTAQSLFSGEGFSSNGQPELFRTPGYPLLLVIGVALDSFWIVSFLQYGMMALILFLTVRIAKNFYPNSINISPLYWWLLLLSPHFLSYPAFLLSETLFTAMLVGSIWFFVQWRKTRRTTQLLASFLLMALLPIVRPIGLVLLPIYGVFCLFIFWRERRRVNLSKPRQLFAVLGLSLLLVFPAMAWSYRNALVNDLFSVSSVSSYNLYHYTAAHLQAKREGRSDAEVQVEFTQNEERWKQQHPNATAGDFARWAQQEGMRSFLETPLLSTALYLRSGLAAFLPEAVQLNELFGLSKGNRGTLSVLHQEGLFAAVHHYFSDQPAALFITVWATLWSLLFLTALARALRSLLSKGDELLWFLTIAAFAQLFVAGPGACPRFLFPSLPLFFILILASDRQQSLSQSKNDEE